MKTIFDRTYKIIVEDIGGVPLNDDKLAEFKKFSDDFGTWIESRYGKAFLTESLTRNVKKAIEDLRVKADNGTLTAKELKDTFYELFKNGSIRSLEFSRNVYSPFAHIVKSL